MDAQEAEQDSGVDESSQSECSETTSTSELPAEIYDPFGDLSPSERSEIISKALARYEQRMKNDNERILKRVLDTIAKTDGTEELHLDMLATHLDRHTTRRLEARTRTDALENTTEDWDPNITRLSDFTSEDGALASWPDSEKLPDHLTGFLDDLELAVRNNASRELLGDAAVDNLQLPAEFVEFSKQCGGLWYANYERESFYCDFASQHYQPDELAQPLDKITEWSGGRYDFEFAAGWLAGKNYYHCVIYYALCQRLDEPDEPWRWRVFVNNWECPDWQGPFDDLFGFLDWYCSRYDQVPWDSVQYSIESIHWKCKEAFEEEE
ncbi:unnamed protein product [Aureobasidium vineae]|uniref:Uncharacterized protein n=1 Tax=Aureobasidium vineae TaxID=2773715 RepID=A0A9N8JD02_9PEZI|nr:unnamed protein product [Aureobasidium vineae]